MFELGTDGPTSILVGLDGSDTSMRAAAYAAGLARRQGARLELVYVRSLHASAVPQAIAAAQQAQDGIVAELREAVEAGAHLLNIEYTFRVREGNPFAELVRLADELHVDAVVVGASTQAGHRLIGSLAGRLVREAHWPVTVVP